MKEVSQADAREALILLRGLALDVVHWETHKMAAQDRAKALVAKYDPPMIEGDAAAPTLPPPRS